ncbi:MAG: TnsA endonuclease N-terminal domain-containing protein [Rhodocyclaceae bacterium]|nr:TnsA endonuclease N-terminal domain-containing protein [Rhodocyclaceae bacterium]
MPVRRIPKNYLCVTGRFASSKNNCILEFESLLERDYMILLEFDDTVERFEEQPVRIPVQAKGRRATTYVPDILVHFRPGRNGKPRKPLLAEVKERKDLAKNQAKYAPKFSAAKQFAAERGWEFDVMTDGEIRIPRLPNLKFLREYHLIEPNRGDVARVLDVLDACGGKSEMADLVDRLCADDDARLQLIPVIWHLVARGDIRADLDHPFTDRTLLTLARRTRKGA